MFYWVQFTKPIKTRQLGTRESSGGTIKADSRERADGFAQTLAMVLHTEVKQLDVIPYPALPYLCKIDHPDFCHDPVENRCIGCTSCPRSPACSE